MEQKKEGYYKHKFLGNGFGFCRICQKSNKIGNHESDWKLRNNNTSKLTVKELIDNTIREEMEQAEQDYTIKGTWYDRQEEGYYRAVYLLNQLL